MPKKNLEDDIPKQKLVLQQAIRRAIPFQIAFYSQEGAGKTLSALLMAAGLAPNGKVAVIDTERGRASLYADNARAREVLPDGYQVLEIDDPYHPGIFMKAIEMVEAAGTEVCIIDSGSDSWEGSGGCTDMAEEDKNMWNRAKLWNKRMMTRAALSDMHIIWCLKAADKVKIIKKEESASGKQEYLPLGLLPIWEKNNLFPMLLTFSVDQKTHESTVIKCHDDLWHLFPKPKLITKADGERLLEWNRKGQAVGEFEQLRKRARAVAGQGVSAYRDFFAALTASQRKALIAGHEENKQLAVDADARRDKSVEEILGGNSTPLAPAPPAGTPIPAFGSAAEPVEFPETFEGPRLLWNGELWNKTELGDYRRATAAA